MRIRIAGKESIFHWANKNSLTRVPQYRKCNQEIYFNWLDDFILRAVASVETRNSLTRTLLLAAFAMVLEQNPLLAATVSGEDNMIGVCEDRTEDHRAEVRPRKAQDKSWCT